MSTEAVSRVVSRLRSSVVLPMHWFSRDSLNEFLAEMEGAFQIVRFEDSALELELSSLPGRPTIMVLAPALIQ